MRIETHDAGETAREEIHWHRLRSEHATLAEGAERLGTLLGRLAARRPDRAEASRALALLDAFHGRLLDHLEREERAGVLERAAAVEPRFHRRVDQLRGEHGQLRALARAWLAGGADWVVVQERFAAFRRLLDAHERQENEVLQRAYTEDLGGRG